MKRLKIQNMTFDQLRERFMKIAVAQSHALDRGDTRTYNRLFDRMIDLMAEF